MQTVAESTYTGFLQSYGQEMGMRSYGRLRGSAGGPVVPRRRGINNVKYVETPCFLPGVWYSIDICEIFTLFT